MRVGDVLQLVVAMTRVILGIANKARVGNVLEVIVCVAVVILGISSCERAWRAVSI
jgi:hypothetical protein